LNQPAPPDTLAILRRRGFVALLVLAAIVGVVVSFVGWAFLEAVHRTQEWVFSDLPDDLGWDTVPAWWYLVVLGLAGIPVAVAIHRLPGHGGHVPAKGLQMGGNEPPMIPGIALAAFATLALGLVLGPEAPLIAIGAGVATMIVHRVRRDAQPQVVTVVAAAGSFAAISVIFGSPIVAAVLVIEATGLGGAMLPLILIPGLISAGIGSLVFVGMSNWSGLSTAAYSLVPLELEPLSAVTWEEIGWTVLLGVAAAVVTAGVRAMGVRVADWVPLRPYVLVPAAGLVVAALAIVFEATTTHGAQEVLFSGQDQLPGLVADAGGWSLGALAMVMVCKGLAWAVSLGSFRGGPTFPAIFIGAAGGIAAGHLPGLSTTVGVAVGMAVMVAAFLKLPLTATVIATALTASAGLAVGPLIIVGVVVAYLSTLVVEDRLGQRYAANSSETAVS
jgi:H+/Cl- antiporter ClcA